MQANAIRDNNGVANCIGMRERETDLIYFKFYILSTFSAFIYFCGPKNTKAESTKDKDFLRRRGPYNYQP